uniref:Uncharacterized protein n=1 Tax=Cacopsylla melanoneura TaxID=428564 RepID=A0A8D8SUM5_9HEMI
MLDWLKSGPWSRMGMQMKIQTTLLVNLITTKCHLKPIYIWFTPWIMLITLQYMLIITIMIVRVIMESGKLYLLSIISILTLTMILIMIKICLLGIIHCLRCHTDLNDRTALLSSLIRLSYRYG